MVVTAVALAGMTVLQADSSYWVSAFWLALVGISSGMFNIPNTAAMMGAVPGVGATVRPMAANLLFGIMMVADDRAVAETWVMGKRLYRKAR